MTNKGKKYKHHQTTWAKVKRWLKKRGLTVGK